MDLARSDPAGSGASVGPAMPNHSVSGKLVLFSPGLGVAHLLLVQKIWESLLGKWKKREAQKSYTLSEEDGYTVSS